VPDGFNQGVWARWDAMSAVEQRDGFLASNGRLVERYEALDAATRASLRIDLGFLPAPVSVGEAAQMRLSEFTLHAWDVRPDTELAPRAVPLVLDMFTSRLGWIARPQELGGRTARLAVTLTGPPATYGLVLGDAITVEQEPPPAPDGELRAPAAAWLRLLTGRLGPRWTPPDVSVTGPVSLDDLRRVFPGF
jgi:hypothetical protein